MKIQRYYLLGILLYLSRQVVHAIAAHEELDVVEVESAVTLGDDSIIGQAKAAASTAPVVLHWNKPWELKFDLHRWFTTFSSSMILL